MARGDQRSKKGKIRAKSYGKSRPRPAKKRSLKRAAASAS
jgi:ribosomal small subunit protein bTHX